MNKVLVKLYVPMIEKQFDIWIPLNKRIYNVIKLLVRAINDFSRGHYNPSKLPTLYNKSTAEPYNVNFTVMETDIRNGTELIII